MGKLVGVGGQRGQNEYHSIYQGWYGILLYHIILYSTEEVRFIIKYAKNGSIALDILF